LGGKLTSEILLFDPVTYASFVHAATRFNWRFGRVFIPLWIAGVALFTFAAAADAIWHFGWDYRWRDVLLGIGMLLFGVLFWFVWNWMFKIVRGLNEVFFGPHPKR
jgi:hypothetical protein